MGYERDNDELRRALRNYGVGGLPVQVPSIGEGRIEEQVLAGPAAFFRVRAKKPVPFSEYADRKRLSPQKMTREELEERSPGRTVAITGAVQEMLERGEKVSQVDLEFDALATQGCLDIDQNVVCELAPWSTVTVKPRKGMLVEYALPVGGVQGVRVWAGRVAGTEEDGSVVLLELFEPATFVSAPRPKAADRIRPGFHSSLSVALGAGTAAALEEHRDGLPEDLAGALEGGKWTEDRREFMLAEPVPFESVRAFCAARYPDSPACAQQAMLMYVVPIRAGSGRFHPLRQETTGY
jgi:hypothetical protein